MGEKLGKPFLGVWERKAAGFYTCIYGRENLEELDGSPCIIAPNHIGPVDKEGEYVGLASGLTPDVMITDRVVEEITGRRPKVVAIFNDDLVVENLGERAQTLQTKMKPFRRGLMKGANTIPVDKAKGAYNRDFFNYFAEAVENGMPIIMFPEGEWRKTDHDYSKKIDIKPGAAHLSKKHSLPIVPTYIYASEDWRKDQKVGIAFGKAINPQGKTKEEISEELGRSIADLQKELQKVDPNVRAQYLERLTS